MASFHDDYEVDFKKKYGEGGYGATFAAKAKASGEALAVKLIDTRKMNAQALKKECEILALLKHPNIIDMKAHGYGLGGHSHIYYIYMELASGGELFDQVIDNGMMAGPLARGFFSQIHTALAECHRWGVAHRDLKLENVLLNSNGVVKLIDFGLSHIYPRALDKTSIDRSQQLFDVCGSKSYAAPEVLAADKRRPGGGYDGFVADTWSLGVCLFAMCSGFFPLDEASRNDWRFGRLQQSQANNPQASATASIYQWYKRGTTHLAPELIDLLDKLLWIDPARRITMDQVAEHPWMLERKLEPVEQPAHNEVTADDYPVYRGAFNPGLEQADTEMFDDDEMPVYRSLGGGMADDASFAMPTLARQRGNFDLLLGESGSLGFGDEPFA